VVLEVSDGRGLGQITPDVSLERGLGLGSLERVELAVRVADAFGVELPSESVAHVDTPRQLLAAVDMQRGTAGGEAPSAASVTVDKATLLPPAQHAPEPK